MNLEMTGIYQYFPALMIINDFFFAFSLLLCHQLKYAISRNCVMCTQYNVFVSLSTADRFVKTSGRCSLNFSRTKPEGLIVSLGEIGVSPY